MDLYKTSLFILKSYEYIEPHTKTELLADILSQIEICTYEGDKIYFSKLYASLLILDNGV